MTEPSPVAGLPGNVLGIGNPDEPVYRIFPLWSFEDALRRKELTLVPPEGWEDPYEILTSRIMVVRGGTQEPLEPHLLPGYAQCWSRTSESDTLLRAYSRIAKDTQFERNMSPRDEGVRVRSTPRKLLRALLEWSPSPPTRSVYIGAVNYYESGDAILQELANRVGQHGIDGMKDGSLRAELLLLKRRAFEYEAEVRLIYLEAREVPGAQWVRFPIDPNALFDEVTFDPRLGGLDLADRKASARSLGYSGPFGETDLYRGQALLIMLDE